MYKLTTKFNLRIVVLMLSGSKILANFFDLGHYSFSSLNPIFKLKVLRCLASFLHGTQLCDVTEALSVPKITKSL